MNKLCLLAADHAGIELLAHLERELLLLGYKTVKFAPDSKTLPSCEAQLDYPDFASMACEKMREEEAVGILICGSGIGISMAANRFTHIRAALCTDTIMARLAREHNDANVLCLGQRLTTKEVALEILEVFLQTKFLHGRHKGRVEKLYTCGNIHGSSHA